MAPRLLNTVLLTALALALAAPAASAHTAIFSADGKVRGSVGLLNEPVSTHAVTGLDVCFSQNTAAPRATIAVTDAGNFTATLRAPSGATHTAALEVPFGRSNCLTFEAPLVLTEPGQYFVDLSGSINGTTFDVEDVKAGGEVLDREDILFPKQADDEDAQGIPAPAAALTVVLLAVLAALRRSR